MKNYELTVERRITYTVKTSAKNEEEASEKILAMASSDLNLWVTDEDTEIIDVFELE